jgi:hypothetical protein
MNRVKGQGGPRKKLNRIHRIKGEDEDVSAEDNDDLTNPEDDASSSMKPGAVFVGDITTRSGRSSTPQTSSTGFNGITVVTDPGTPFEPQIVAFLAPNDDDEQQIESRIAQKAEELLRRQMEEGEVIAAAEVIGDDSSTCCGLKKRTLLLLLGLLSLLMIIGGVVGGVLSAMPHATPAPKSGRDPLLDELMLLNTTFEKDLWQFEDPKSPQYQALEWLKTTQSLNRPVDRQVICCSDTS